MISSGEPSHNRETSPNRSNSTVEGTTYDNRAGCCRPTDLGQKGNITSKIRPLRVEEPHLREYLERASGSKFAERPIFRADIGVVEKVVANPFTSSSHEFFRRVDGPDARRSVVADHRHEFS